MKANKKHILPDALTAKAKNGFDFGEFTFIPQMVFSGQSARWEIVDTRDGKPLTVCVSEADLKYARLFLCAPKMLKLLQRIKSSLEWCEMEGSIECETEHEIAELLDEIKGIIK